MNPLSNLHFESTPLFRFRASVLGSANRQKGAISRIENHDDAERDALNSTRANIREKRCIVEQTGPILPGHVRSFVYSIRGVIARRTRAAENHSLKFFPRPRVLEVHSAVAASITRLHRVVVVRCIRYLWPDKK